VAASLLDELAAASFDVELSRRFPWLDGMTVEATPLVLRNMTSTERRWDLEIVDRTWRAGRPRPSRTKIYDVEFTLFGPVYYPKRSTIRISGFADGTSLRPDLLGGTSRGIDSWRRALRRRYSRLYFSHSDVIVAEAEHVRDSLQSAWDIPAERIRVIPNVVNGLFHEPTQWRTLEFMTQSDEFYVCYIARGYPHKNIDLLGAVGASLADDHGIRAKFVLTLTEQEWLSQSVQVRQHCVNVGPIDVAQAPQLYLKCDAAIFPSLLESFSASPLEALTMGCPLIASRRPFVSEFVGDAAEYFDPSDPIEAAAVLARLLMSPTHRAALIKRGFEQAKGFARSDERALAYLELIDECIASLAS
jgi:glycosyltransferase involved in cell wall biosynthesis